MGAFMEPEAGLRDKVPASHCRLDVPVPSGILKTQNRAFRCGKIGLDGRLRNQLCEQLFPFPAGGPAVNQMVIGIRDRTGECDHQPCH
jgi:hypothetical protein